jgi:YihY family inner membrane protein
MTQDHGQNSAGHLVAIARQVLRFLGRTLGAFLANGGFELAGAIAYNSLLSVVPLLLLVTVTFARFVDQERFIRAVATEVRHLLPSAQAQPVNEAIVALLEEPFSGGLVGLATLLFFSTLAFRTLQHALDVIFRHRREVHPPRPAWASILISLGYTIALGVVAFLQALALVRLEKFPALAAIAPRWAGAIGVIGLSLLLASIYLVMPLGKGNPRTALIGGTLAALLWQAVQNVMLWYFGNVSKVNLIYGSLAGIVVVLFSFELAAAIVLFAAQIIAEVEKNWNTGRHWYETPRSSVSGSSAPAQPTSSAPPKS